MGFGKGWWPSVHTVGHYNPSLCLMLQLSSNQLSTACSNSCDISRQEIRSDLIHTIFLFLFLKQGLRVLQARLEHVIKLEPGLKFLIFLSQKSGNYRHV